MSFSNTDDDDDDKIVLIVEKNPFRWVKEDVDDVEREYKGQIINCDKHDVDDEVRGNLAINLEITQTSLQLFI